MFLVTSCFPNKKLLQFINESCHEGSKEKEKQFVFLQFFK